MRMKIWPWDGEADAYIWYKCDICNYRCLTRPYLKMCCCGKYMKTNYGHGRLKVLCA